MECQILVWYWKLIKIQSQMGNRFEKDRLPNPRFPSLRSNEASVTFVDEGHPMGSNRVQQAKPLAWWDLISSEEAIINCKKRQLSWWLRLTLGNEHIPRGRRNYWEPCWWSIRPGGWAFSSTDGLFKTTLKWFPSQTSNCHRSAVDFQGLALPGGSPRPEIICLKVRAQTPQI